MGIAILIPVYNEVFYTKKCIVNLKEALKNYSTTVDSPLQSDIIVIDDGSTDGTSGWLSENHPEITILEGDGNLFWSAAINMGIEYVIESAKHTHILFWNKDLYIEPDYFTTMHHLLNSVPENTLLASKMYRKNTPNVLFSFGGSYNPKTDKKVNIGSGKVDGPQFSEITKIDWCGGMAVIMPVNMFKEIGVCDAKNFPQYDGDTDLFLRAKKAGYQLYVYPELKAWNLHENTGRKEKFNLKNYFWYLNNIRSYRNLGISYRFLKKHATGLLPYLFFSSRYLWFTIRYVGKIMSAPFR